MLYFKKEGELHRVREAEVIYIQQLKRDVVFSTEKGEYSVKNYKIAGVENKLKENFFKCHSYMIVNTAKIDIVRPGEVVFKRIYRGYVQSSFRSHQKGIEDTKRSSLRIGQRRGYVRKLQVTDLKIKC